jgi:hypothetical protein
MPDQSKAYARHFAKKKDVSRGGLYVPTKEPADIYSQVPSHHGLAALRDSEEEDVMTEFLLEHASWVYTRLRKLIDWVLNRHRDEELLPQKYIRITTLRTKMNIFVAILLPIFLAGTLGGLSRLRSDKMRIVVLGILALVLTMSLIVLVPKLKRSDLWAITAAYFAVGGVFIGAKSTDTRYAML